MKKTKTKKKAISTTNENYTEIKQTLQKDVKLRIKATTKRKLLNMIKTHTGRIQSFQNLFFNGQNLKRFQNVEEECQSLPHYLRGGREREEGRKKTAKERGGREKRREGAEGVKEIVDPLMKRNGRILVAGRRGRIYRRHRIPLTTRFKGIKGHYTGDSNRYRRIRTYKKGFKALAWSKILKALQ